MTLLATNVCSVFDPEMTGNLGTTAWCAPELLTATDKTRYSIKVHFFPLQHTSSRHSFLSSCAYFYRCAKCVGMCMFAQCVDTFVY